MRSGEKRLAQVDGTQDNYCKEIRDGEQTDNEKARGDIYLRNRW